MNLYHDGVLGGHSGVHTTYKKLSSVFYWPKLEKDVRQYVRECEVCQKYKFENIATPGLLQPLPIPNTCWSEVSMDFIEGLPKSNGMEVIMVVMDKLSKYAHFIGLAHPYSALKVAQIYLDQVYRLHGMP